MKIAKLPTKLKKEPLVDAIFEIRFSSSVPASSVLPGVLFSNVPDKERKIERLPTADIPTQIRDTDPNLRFHPLLRLHWGQFLILIGDASLGIACKMPYVGWVAFKKQIIEVVNLVLQTGIINTLDRYAIKYVDVIDGEGLSEQISRLNMNLKIGNHSLTSESFNVRIEIQRDDFTHVVQVAAPTSVITFDGQTRQGVLTDIDTIRNYSTNDFDVLFNKLPEYLEEIHTNNKKMFFECLKPETVNYLEPDYD